MHSRSRLLLLALLMGAGTLALAWDAAAQEPVTSRLKLSIGGYIKPEFIYRTNNGGVAFVGAIPGSQNFGFSIVPQKNTIAAANGSFVAASNETRFNFTLTAPDWRGLKSLGFIEMDFDGDTASTIERYCPAGTICWSGSPGATASASSRTSTTRPPSSGSWRPTGSWTASRPSWSRTAWGGGSRAPGSSRLRSPGWAWRPGSACSSATVRTSTSPGPAGRV